MENNGPSSVKPNKMPIIQIHILTKKIHVYDTWQKEGV